MNKMKSIKKYTVHEIIINLAEYIKARSLDYILMFQLILEVCTN